MIYFNLDVIQVLKIMLLQLQVKVMHNSETSQTPVLLLILVKDFRWQSRVFKWYEN